jgi:hypothetical protein
MTVVYRVWPSGGELIPRCVPWHWARITISHSKTKQRKAKRVHVLYTEASGLHNRTTFVEDYPSLCNLALGGFTKYPCLCAVPSSAGQAWRMAANTRIRSGFGGFLLLLLVAVDEGSCLAGVEATSTPGEEAHGGSASFLCFFLFGCAAWSMHLGGGWWRWMCNARCDARLDSPCAT